MGRYLSTSAAKTVYYGLRDILPTYGTGAFRFYGASGSFTIPSNVNEIRVTALGAGGGGAGSRTPCLCNYGCIWCWLGPVCQWDNFPQCTSITGLCWRTDFICVGQTPLCFSGYNGCLYQLQNTCSGGGGGGGAYVIATVGVTPGCVCCVIVGAAGTHCCGTLALNACCSCFCNCVTLGSGGTGGFSCFPGVCAAGGVGGCLGCCNVSGGCGGNGYTTGSATCVAIKQGNTGCNGCIACMCFAVPCCYFSAGTCNCGTILECTVFTCSQTPTQTNYGGASGSPAGNGGCIGPFPGSLQTDVYGCRGFDGSTNCDTCLSSKWNNTIRWPGEVILSTARYSNAAIVGTAAGYPACCYCVTHYGGGYTQYSQPFATGCTFHAAGCGGGGAGGLICTTVASCVIKCTWCNCSAYKGGYNIIRCACCGMYCICMGSTGQAYGGTPGAGFVVIEF